MISVIIPMYNAEAFIERSVNSVLNNTYQDYELLLINDGSTDDTLRVANDLAKKDKRIRVIDKEHVSVGHTRNRGIDEAKGEYLAFIDADDEVVPTYLEKLITFMEDEKLDWVFCNCKYIIDKTGKEIFEKYLPTFSEKTVIEGEDLSKVRTAVFIAFNEKGKDTKNIPNNVMCLFKKSIIDENNIRINENIKYGEDLLFNYTYVNYIHRFGYIPEQLYIVRKRWDSSMGNFMNGGNFKGLIDLFDEVAKIDRKFQRDITNEQSYYMISQLSQFMEALAFNRKEVKVDSTIDALKELSKNSVAMKRMKENKDMYQWKRGILWKIRYYFFSHDLYNSIYVRHQIHAFIDGVKAFLKGEYQPWK